VDRTIFVDCGKVRATDFDLTESDQTMLFESGRAAAEKFLATWDFDAYKAKYRESPAPAPAPAPVAELAGSDGGAGGGGGGDGPA
jgi:NTE family protein